MSHQSRLQHRTLWESWNESGGPRYPGEKIVQFTFRNFAPEMRGATRVLDLGCGSGVNSWFLAREGFEVVGTDLSMRGLLNTRERLRRDGLVAVLVQADAARQPFPDATFDYLVCSRMLELLPDPADQERLVGECSRLLRPGARGMVLFASRLDYGYLHPEMSPGPFYPPEEEWVERTFRPRFSHVNVDIYQTTYENRRFTEHNFLVTFVK
jgi:ubiquinone/menaquinone biosynthesis C-methylase UbiE